MSIDDSESALWNDFLELCEKYQHVMEPREFGFLMIGFNTRMMMDLAPSCECAMKTIKEAVQSGLDWHYLDKEQDEKENN